MRRRFHTLLVLAVAVVPAGAAPANAQTGSADAATEAGEAFELGSRLFEEQNWSGALASFQRAYELQPHYSVLFNMGYCLRELHRYPEALDAFQRYLTDGADQVRPDKRAEAEQFIADLRSFISHVRITADVDGAEILVNDQSRGASPLAEPLGLGAGHYVVVGRAPGRRDARVEFDLGAGEEREIALALEPLETTPPPPPPPPPPGGGEMETPGWYTDWLGWTLGGVGIVAGVLGGLMVSSGLDDQRKGDAELDISQADRYYDDADTSIGWGIGLAAVGGAALITGIVLLAVPESPEAPPEDEPAVALTPLIGPFALGLAGTF